MALITLMSALDPFQDKDGQIDSSIDLSYYMYGSRVQDLSDSVA